MPQPGIAIVAHAPAASTIANAHGDRLNRCIEHCATRMTNAEPYDNSPPDDA